MEPQYNAEGKAASQKVNALAGKLTRQGRHSTETFPQKKKLLDLSVDERAPVCKGLRVQS